MEKSVIEDIRAGFHVIATKKKKKKKVAIFGLLRTFPEKNLTIEFFWHPSERVFTLKI